MVISKAAFGGGADLIDAIGSPIVHLARKGSVRSGSIHEVDTIGLYEYPIWAKSRVRDRKGYREAYPDITILSTSVLEFLGNGLVDTRSWIIGPWLGSEILSFAALSLVSVRIPILDKGGPLVELPSVWDRWVQAESLLKLAPGKGWAKCSVDQFLHTPNAGQDMKGDLRLDRELFPVVMPLCLRYFVWPFRWWFAVAHGAAQTSSLYHRARGTILCQPDSGCLHLPARQEHHPPRSEAGKSLPEWRARGENWWLWTRHQTGLSWRAQEVRGLGLACGQGKGETVGKSSLQKNRIMVLSH